MSFAVGLFLCVCVSAASGAERVNDQLRVDPADWPWWRGPERNGTAQADQNVPTSWSATENIVWKSPVLGRGHGSPTVAGKRIYLATADEQQDVQSVLCYDRTLGTLMWRKDVHRGGSMRKNE